MVEVIGALPENVNFGIKASTVRQFLTSSGLPSKKSERTDKEVRTNRRKIHRTASRDRAKSGIDGDVPSVEKE